MEIVDLTTEADNRQVDTIRNYYQLHAKLYQATRWTFLFGRKRLVNALKLPSQSNKTILEVGCGTGHNLNRLANRYPNLHLIGVDISPDMLQVASKKLQSQSRRVLFLEKPYAPGAWTLPGKPDVILFSYCLTMINPGWETALQRAHDDLGMEGMIAVVDFHFSPIEFFRRWMGFNHVRMDKHLLPALEARFTAVHIEIRQAYGGLWQYFLFVGENKR